MAVTDAYATASEYRSAVSKTDDSDDLAVDSDLKAISRWLDRKLGRFFTLDTADQTRTYWPKIAPAAGRALDWAESENPWKYGGWARWLHVDDMAAAPTSITVDDDGDGTWNGDVAWTASDYELWPTNAALGPEPAPYTAIFVPNWSSKFGFPADKRVRVIAKFGWPAVPEAIKRATIELCAIKRLESPRATSRITEMDQVVSTSKVAQSIIGELTKVYMKGSAII